jgi:hypothetical protein
MANAPAEQSGLSSGLVNVGRMVGATLGVAALGMLFGGRVEAAAQDVPRFMDGMHNAFLMGGAVEFVGAAIALLWFRSNSLDRQTATSPPEADRRELHVGRLNRRAY